MVISRLPRPLENYSVGIGPVIFRLQMFPGYSDAEHWLQSTAYTSCWQNQVAKLSGESVFQNQSPSISEQNAEGWI